MNENTALDFTKASDGLASITDGTLYKVQRNVYNGFVEKTNLKLKGALL